MNIVELKSLELAIAIGTVKYLLLKSKMFKRRSLRNIVSQFGHSAIRRAIILNVQEKPDHSEKFDNFVYLERSH